VSAYVDQEEVAHLFEKYDLLSLPVIDEERTLVGRITIDDVVDVIEEEATEDMLKLAGVGDEPLGLPGPLTAVRSRLPWLGVNLLTATVSAATISLFEHTIQTLAIAAAFMTIVASQGGNAGVQTMTLVVRGLALGEVRSRNARRMLSREFLIALSNGAVLGVVAGVTVYLWRENLGLALVMGFAMIINLIVAAVLGTLIPLSIRRLGADPALSSPVFVTAGTDVLGFFIFLGLLTTLV
ncbi:MAG: magnesium transporter, partial [Candidatus Binatia bacterium]